MFSDQTQIEPKNISKEQNKNTLDAEMLQKEQKNAVVNKSLDDVAKLERQVKTAKEREELNEYKKDIEDGQITAKERQEILQIKAFFVDVGINISDTDLAYISDDYDDLVKKFGKDVSMEEIIRQIRINIEENKKDSGGQGMGDENDVEQQNIRSERSKAVSQIIFGKFPNLNKVEDGNNKNDFVQRLIENVQAMQYLMDNIDKLEEDKKKKLKEILEAIIAMFLEGKIIEIYEIQMDANGKIVIRGRDSSGKGIIVNIDTTKIELSADMKKKISDFVADLDAKQNSDTYQVGLQNIAKKLNIGHDGSKPRSDR